LGYQKGEGSLVLLTNATRDPDPAVRAAAVQSLARLSKERGDLEGRVAPLLADSEPRVRKWPRWRCSSRRSATPPGWNGSCNIFQFENIHAGGLSEGVAMENGDRPLASLETRPPFLEIGTAAAPQGQSEGVTPFSPCCCPARGFRGVALLMKPPEAASRDRREPGSNQAVMTAIALSRDAK
jgi:hypothetical protein